MHPLFAITNTLNERLMAYVIDEQREEKEIQAKYDELLAACREIYPVTQEQEDEIFRAFSLAKKAHAGTRRKSGEPYIFHPLAVALIAVKEVGLGPIAVVCALLHDVVEDTNITLDEIRTIFGDRVAVIVDGVTKIGDVKVMSDSKQAENYRKILLSMCDDAYVIFLKLCLIYKRIIILYVTQKCRITYLYNIFYTKAVLTYIKRKCISD